MKMFSSSYIVLIGVMSQLSAIVCSCIGFGDAIIFYLLFAIAKELFPDVVASIPALNSGGESELHYVAILLAVRAVWSFGFQAYLARQFIRWELLRYAAPVFVVFGLLGCVFLDLYGDAMWVHWVLGIIFSLFAILHSVGTYFRTSSSASEKNEKEKIDEANKQQNEFPEELSEERIHRISIALAVTAVPSSILGGAITVGAPPLAILALFQSWPKDLVRGMLPASLEIIWIVRNIYDFVLLPLFVGENSSASSSSFVIRYDYIAMLSGGFVGTYIGNDIGLLLPGPVHKRTVIFLLFLAGITLGKFVSAFVLIFAVVAFAVVEVGRYYVGQ